MTAGPLTILTISLPPEAAEKLLEPGGLDRLNQILDDAKLPPVLYIRPAEPDTKETTET